MSAEPAVNVPLADPAPAPSPRRRMRVVSALPQPPVSVVVPCFNEEEGLPTLLQRLEGLAPLGWEVVFVDDGSRDGTFETLLTAARTRPWMRVVRHGTNLGLGAGMKTGFTCARAPIVCTIDSDCTYPPERLPELVSLVQQGADIATASAWHPDSVPPEGGTLRLALSRAVSRVYRRLIGQDVHTFTCLFRAYRRDIVDRIDFRATGFAAVAELMLRGMVDGCRVRELPMQLGARRFGESKLRMGDAILSHAALLTLTVTLLSRRWARGRLGLL